MDSLDEIFVRQMLLTHPETGEEVYIKYEPQENGDGSYSLYVADRHGQRTWKHTIRTEEV